MGRPAKNSQPAYGRHLAKLRADANLTQQQLAEAAKVQQSNIAFWEHSAKPPRGEVLPRLAKALGVSVDVLLNVEAGKSPKAHRGPSSRIEKLLEEVAKLPRRRQQKIADVLEALITQEAI